MKRLAIIFFGIVVMFTSCRTQVAPTQIDVYLPDKHYPPVAMGTDIVLTYKMKNVGKHPFVFKEILPDCSSITVIDETPHILPHGDSLLLYFNFKTTRNVGLTKHYIRIFGNVDNPKDSLGVYTPGVITLSFDVPIVRHSIDMSDYEEIYFASRPEYEYLVDGRWE